MLVIIVSNVRFTVIINYDQTENSIETEKKSAFSLVVTKLLKLFY